MVQVYIFFYILQLFTYSSISSLKFTPRYFRVYFLKDVVIDFKRHRFTFHDLYFPSFTFKPSAPLHF